MEVMNKVIAIKSHIDGFPQEHDFEVKIEPLILSVEPESDYVIVKTLYVSIDPYQLNRMKTYSPSHKTHPFVNRITPGEAICASGVGKVVASGKSDFKKDDLVCGILMNWGEYTISKGADLIKLDPMGGFPLSYHLGVLSLNGLTAYGGFFKVCKPKKGEKVFVSAASGCVGNLVGQFAKLFGCYVVGSAGTQDKVNILKEKLGFDDAFNYKDEIDFESALKRYFPDGIDIYFDNVGSEMLQAAVANMNPFGRIAICGLISEYTNTKIRAAPDFLEIMYKRISIQGFLAADFMNIYGEFISNTTDYLRNNEMHVLEDISNGLESIPGAFIGLFRGNNIGKRIVKISDD